MSIFNWHCGVCGEEDCVCEEGPARDKLYARQRETEKIRILNEINNKLAKILECSKSV